jgi:glycosyltransferase involved in cell wall biosynthesis
LVKKHFPRRTIYGISHGTDLRQMINCGKLADMIRPYVSKIDAAFALHEEQSRQIKDIFDIDEGRVHVLGSGYNSALFNKAGRKERTAGEPVRITYAGKISRPKGVPELLTALFEIYERKIREASDNSLAPIEVTLAGGCQDEALRPMMDELPEYVTWLGQIPQPALAELLRQTDIFVLPSYFEGLPLVLIEAMASGALPISTDLPGIREWVDANIIDSNLVLVPMPEMKSIDEPTDKGRTEHTGNLSYAISGVIDAMKSGVPLPTPDTRSVTWDAVAGRILEHFK